MQLGVVLGIDISKWEEILIAGSYLFGRALNADLFEEIRSDKIKSSLFQLNNLPELYARELCFEIIRDNDVAT